ncbi:MAG: NIPSNAP family protein [Dehalococcoidia bacterium]|nr:NIPSNAP family protein [Dehalococcoidia bacterium]
MLYELRLYYVNPGKMPALQARFRDTTMGFFEKHGIKSVAYWTNTVGGRSDEFVYIVAFDSMAHRERAWGTFQADPAWHAARAATEADGPLVHHIENRFLTPTDFSPLR